MQVVHVHGGSQHATKGLALELTLPGWRLELNVACIAEII